MDCEADLPPKGDGNDGYRQACFGWTNCDDNNLIPLPINGEFCDQYKCNDLLSQQYMSCFYWSITMLMKTPYTHPDTVFEKVYASIMVLVGAIVFALLLGNMTAFINSFDKSGAVL